MREKSSTLIGKMRHRIKFQTLSLVGDGQGGSVETWTDFAEVWADVKPTSGRERLYAQRIEDLQDHKITIRYLEGINTTMRIDFQGRIFQIKDITNEVESRFWQTLMTQEVTGT